MGRPSKLTPERQEKIIAAIRAGNYIETAAAYAGISKQTFYQWLKRGEAAEAGIYHDFLDAITRAQAEAEVGAVAIIRKAMPDDWRAAVEFLKRRYPDRWGKAVQELTGKDGGPIEIRDARERLAGRIASIASRSGAEAAAGEPERG